MWVIIDPLRTVDIPFLNVCAECRRVLSGAGHVLFRSGHFNLQFAQSLERYRNELTPSWNASILLILEHVQFDVNWV